MSRVAAHQPIMAASSAVNVSAIVSSGRFVGAFLSVDAAACVVGTRISGSLSG